MGLSLLSNKIERLLPEYRGYIACVIGLAFSFIFFKFLSFIWPQIKTEENIGRLAEDGVSGAILGLIAFLCSIVVLYISDHSTDFSKLELGSFLNNLFFQVRASTIEEVGFRLGIVGIASQVFNKRIAIILGSIPFGLLHLLNFLSGQEIVWLYIWGTAVAGLFLSVIFLRSGLWAAIFAHYSWNVFSSSFGRISTFSQEDLEGATSTYLILIIMSAFLLYQDKNKQTI